MREQLRNPHVKPRSRQAFYVRYRRQDEPFEMWDTVEGDIRDAIAEDLGFYPDDPEHGVNYTELFPETEREKKQERAAGTLQEIADELQVSRSRVGEMLKKTMEKVCKAPIHAQVRAEMRAWLNEKHWPDVELELNLWMLSSWQYRYAREVGAPMSVFGKSFEEFCENRDTVLEEWRAGERARVEKMEAKRRDEIRAARKAYEERLAKRERDLEERKAKRKAYLAEYHRERRRAEEGGSSSAPDAITSEGGFSAIFPGEGGSQYFVGILSWPRRTD